MSSRQALGIDMRRSAIASLDDGLQPYRSGLSPTPEWRGQQAMSDVLALIRSRHKGGARSVDRGRIMAAVDDYLLSGDVPHQADLFNLCIGAGWLDVGGKGILVDRTLRGKLFSLAETVTGRTKRLRTFRNLLYAYWSFPLHDDATPLTAIEGWKELRVWLKERHAAFSRHPARKPTWFNALTPYLHLLEENPCAPYAKSLLDGNLDELQRAIECLFIPTDSWLKTEAVMAQIGEAVQWPDDPFLGVLPDLLKMATGNAGIQVPDGVTQRAIAKLVVRYATQKQYEPHEGLFMLAVDKIGNPWRQRSAWDALVCDESGDPCSLSREMVNVWLKDRLIGEFFTDSGQEKSRSELWQRYSVFMQEISVASDTQGRALVLRMGDFLVIVPKNRDKPIEAFPWQAFFSDGGTKLLGKNAVDGGGLQNVLANRKPTIRAHQTFEEVLKFFEFVISAKTRLPSLPRR
jgi:hypothetical protein